MAGTAAASTDLSAHGFQTLHADRTLLVLDKPAGLLSVPGRGDDKQDCLSSRVQACYPDALVVHRLDMATSGLMLMARSAAAQRALSLAFAERRISKRYQAVVLGCLQTPPDAVEGWSTIDLAIAADWPRRPLRVIDSMRGKPSLTRWKLDSVDATASTSRLLLEPLTGRSHQLRVHLQALGHPIVGDALYGTHGEPGTTGRLLLHACSLGLVHPDSGEWIDFASAPPF